MIKKFIVLFVIARLLIADAAAEATTEASVNALSFWQGLNGVMVQQLGSIDADGCGRSDWYILPNSDPRYSEIYGFLLALYMTGKKVVITVNGCTDGYPKIVHVRAYRG